MKTFDEQVEERVQREPRTAGPPTYGVHLRDSVREALKGAT